MDDPAVRDPRISKYALELVALPLARHEDETFADQDVYLDGREFVNCMFQRCRMHILLGRFRLLGTNSVPDCEWVLEGPTESTVKLLEYLSAGGDQRPIQ